MKFLVVVVGPTAVGKTALAIELARHLNTHVISADSRQFYREMEIGTAKPTSEEMGDVPHHFVNSRSIHEDYDVGAFEKDALLLIEDLFSDKQVLVLAGGSGLYVDAVCRGFDELPEVLPEVREQLIQLFESEGIGALQQELSSVDPEYYGQVDVRNPQRLMRALEVWRSTGRKFSSFRKGVKAQRPFEVIKVGLNTERTLLYERIDLRMDVMIDQGLFEEAKLLYEFRSLNALQTVGYKEIFGYLQGEYDKTEAIRLLKRNSRRYAKRQLTWFKRDEQTTWFEPGKGNQVITHLKEVIALKLSESKD